MYFLISFPTSAKSLKFIIVVGRVCFGRISIEVSVMDFPEECTVDKTCLAALSAVDWSGICIENLD